MKMIPLLYCRAWSSKDNDDRFPIDLPPSLRKDFSKQASLMKPPEKQAGAHFSQP
jgi:hypothetical protein